MKHVLIAVLAAASLAACASPYQQALDSKVLLRPEPMTTAADQRALAPYDNSQYFRDR
jgi:hypothetical protein